MISLVFAGLAWTSVVSTLNAELQLFLPVWVRARGLPTYLVVFTGSQAVASVIWGQVTERVGVQTTFLVAAGLVVAGVVAGAVLTVPDTVRFDGEPAVYWSAPRITADTDLDAGPVLIKVTYTVTSDRETAYLEAMQQLSRSRRRTGASRWELYRDAEQPHRFVELFRVPSWEEHLRQHEGRLTVGDQTVEELALSFSDPPATAVHLLTP